MRNVISLRSSAKCHPSRRAVAPSRKPNRAPLGHAHGLYPQATDALSTSFVPVPRCFRDGCGSRRSKSSPRHGSTVSQVLEADKKVRELAVDQSDPWARLVAHEPRRLPVRYYYYYFPPCPEHSQSTSESRSDLVHSMLRLACFCSELQCRAYGTAGACAIGDGEFASMLRHPRGSATLPSRTNTSDGCIAGDV